MCLENVQLHNVHEPDVAFQNTVKFSTELWEMIIGVREFLDHSAGMSNWPSSEICLDGELYINSLCNHQIRTSTQSQKPVEFVFVNFPDVPFQVIGNLRLIF